jgi:hypothetical protein
MGRGIGFKVWRDDMEVFDENKKKDKEEKDKTLENAGLAGAASLCFGPGSHD